MDAVGTKEEEAPSQKTAASKVVQLRMAGKRAVLANRAATDACGHGPVGPGRSIADTGTSRLHVSQDTNPPRITGNSPTDAAGTEWQWILEMNCHSFPESAGAAE